jgi:hypothetical protein
MPAASDGNERHDSALALQRINGFLEDRPARVRAAGSG